MHRSRSLVTAAPTLFLTALLAGCGGGGYGNSPTAPSTTGTTTGTTTGSTSNAITIADNSFTPITTTVAPGTTATWTWKGSNQHDVTFDDGTKSSTQSSGTYQRTFAAAGTYPYHCSIHGTAMSGTITVK
jgi:plastocyanin